MFKRPQILDGSKIYAACVKQVVRVEQVRTTGCAGIRRILWQHLAYLACERSIGYETQ